MRTAEVLAAALLSLAYAGGAARGADREAEARRHYQEGSKAFDLGEFERAVKAFRDSYNAKPDPATLFNIAQAYRLSGDLKQAVFFYRSYLRNDPNARNRVEVEERIKSLEEQMARGSAAPPPAAPAGPPPPGASTAPPPAPPPGASAAPPPAPPMATPGSSPSSPLATSAPPPPPAEIAATAATGAEPPQPLYKKWWVWAAAGAAVLGVVVVAIAASSGGGARAPASKLGTTPVF